MIFQLPYISSIVLIIWIVFFLGSGLLMFLFFGDKLNWPELDFSYHLSNLRTAVLILLFAIFMITFIFHS